MTTKESVLRLLEQTRHPAASAGLLLIEQHPHPHSFTSGLEERDYIHSLYRLRLDRAQESGALDTGLAELVERLARLDARQVRLSTFTLGPTLDFAVLTDPRITQIIGYL